jgi:uncharacterized membrane protein
MLLLSNASGTGSAAKWDGGNGTFICVGTFGGATVTLQVLGPDGSTYVAVNAATTLTTAGMGTFSLPPGQIRALVSGGAPSGLYARAEKVRQ